MKISSQTSRQAWPRRRIVALALPVLAVACWLALPQARAEEASVLVPFSGAKGAQAPEPWHFSSLPRKQPTRFEVVALASDKGTQRVLKVTADDSYGNLVHRTQIPLAPGPTLAWRWRVDQFVLGADLRTRDGDDGAAKLCVSFDLPTDKLPLVERTRLALARAATGEDVPSESLCYVWDAKEPKGTALVNAFTQRIRMLVLESGPTTATGGWVAERRDLLADYRRAFGREAGGELPEIVAVEVSADADNTHAQGLAYFSDIDLKRGTLSPAAAATP